MTLRLLVLLLASAPAFAHGGSFQAPGRGVPPALGGQPIPSNPTAGGTHTWLTWWSYNQLQYTQFRHLQAERRGPVTNLDGKREQDPNAWRARVRTQFTPALIEALTDDDKEVRTAAAIALGKWRAILAIPDLQRAYEKDDDKEVRESAILGLALMRDPSLRPYLVTVASNQDTSVRERGYALLGLGLIGDGESRAFLLSLLSPDDKQARALLPGATKEPRVTVGKRAQFRCAAVAALTLAKGTDLTDEFLRIAFDQRLEDEVRAYAVTALGKTRASSAIAKVMPLLKSESEPLRRSAALALGRMASRTDTDVLDALAARVADDRDRVTRHFSTLSLGIIGGPRAFELLKKHYDAGNKEARGFFLVAYGLSKEADAGPILAEVAKNDPDPMMAAAASLALGLLEDSAHIPALRETFDHAKSWTLMQTSMLSLALMNDVASADKIENVLITRRTPEVRMAAAISFALLRQWSALPVLMGILREEKSIVTLTTISQVMGFLATEKAVEPLVALYRDKGLQRQARAFALVAVGALGDPEDMPLLVRLAFDLNYTIPSDPVDEAITIL